MIGLFCTVNVDCESSGFVQRCNSSLTDKRPFSSFEEDFLLLEEMQDLIAARCAVRFSYFVIYPMRGVMRGRLFADRGKVDVDIRKERLDKVGDPLFVAKVLHVNDQINKP